MAMPKGIPGSAPLCAAPDCDRPNEARGFCHAHYQRHKQGDLQVDKPIRAYGRKGCRIEGCPQRHYSYGLCESHVRLWKRNGDPNVRLKAPKHQANFIRHGYRFIYANGREVQEHRHVMEQILGRPLLPNEEVHHRNGQRADNRPENLELWVTRQPKGQRAADLLAWAEEIVARYGPERDLL